MRWSFHGLYKHVLLCHVDISKHYKDPYKRIHSIRNEIDLNGRNARLLWSSPTHKWNVFFGIACSLMFLPLLTWENICRGPPRGQPTCGYVYNNTHSFGRRLGGSFTASHICLGGLAAPVNKKRISIEIVNIPKVAVACWQYVKESTTSAICYTNVNLDV